MADVGAGAGAPSGAPDDAEVRRRVRTFALRLTGDPHHADDVAQETLARALRPGTPRELPYLFSIALNIVRSDARRAATRRTAPVPVETVADPRSDDPLARLVAEEERARFWAVLGKVPERERNALLLRFGEGLSCAEIARTLEITPNAVSCLLHRGKDRLRSMLSPRSLSS